MKKIFLLVLLFFPLVIWGQQAETGKFNFDFEQVSFQSGLPVRWYQNNINGYTVKTDTIVRHGGKRSLRIDGPDIYDGKSFSYVFTQFPAEYPGKDMKVRLWLKLDSVTGGMVNVLVRINGKNSLLGSGSFTGEVSGTADWKEYEIPVYYFPAGARYITIGIMHAGNGTLWADDMSVEFDGEKIENITPVPPVIPTCELDTEFDGGSGLDETAVKRICTPELQKLAFIWGFLKYHHPAVARGDRNWDYELFRFMKKLADLPQEQSSDPLYLEWIAAMGEYQTTGPSSAYISPASGRMNELKITGELRGKLDELIRARRPEKNYYAELYDEEIPVFTNENPYGNFELPDAGFRMLALLRYWNVIEYFFPYKDLIGKDWLELLPEFFPLFLNAGSRLEYHKAILALAASIHDSHAIVYESGRFYSGFGGTRFHNAVIKFADRRAIVTGSWNVNGDVSPLRPGDELLELDGKKIKDLWEEYAPYVPASNEAVVGRNLAQQVLCTDGIRLQALAASREGGKREVMLRTYPGGLAGNFRGKKPGFKWVAEDIAYTFPASIEKEDSLRQLGERIKKSKVFIIDMRCYPYGGFLPEILGHLYPDSTAFIKYTFGSIERPGTFTVQPPVKMGRKNPDYYKGKILVLADENTQSMAEGCLMAFRAAPDCLIIGSTTAGANGNVPNIVLPGGFTGNFTAVGVCYPDGTPTQRVGIIPDIYCAPTVKDLREGKDRVLEKAIETAQKFIKDR